MAAEPRERPLHELLSRDMVDIYVGPETTHWILHEKLLCHRSKFFRDIFYKNDKKKGAPKNSTYGLPDDDDEPFRLFVGWLYSDALPMPKEEKELAPLFDLYLMAEKWEIQKLVVDVLETVRKWYHDSDTWPGLRRVQYVYANTEPEAPMRRLLVQCVARMLVVGRSEGEGMPPHWEKALRKDAQMAVDIIVCVQKWHVEEDLVPDARSESVFSMVEEGDRGGQIKKEAGGKAGEETGNGAGSDGELVDAERS